MAIDMAAAAYSKHPYRDVFYAGIRFNDRVSRVSGTRLVLLPDVKVGDRFRVMIPGKPKTDATITAIGKRRKVLAINCQYVYGRDITVEAMNPETGRQLTLTAFVSESRKFRVLTSK